MDFHYKQEVTVGALVAVGVVLFIAGTMWLSGKSFSRAPTITIEFSNIETLKRGSPIKVSGVQLGTVEEIDFQGFGRVLVRANLDPKIQLRRDASASLASVGLVADAVINLNPGQAPEPLPEGTVIQGSVEGGLLAGTTGLAARAETALAGISEIANKRLAEDLTRTLAAVERLASYYADPRGPSAEVVQTLEEVQRVGRRLDSTLADLRLRGTVESADSLMRSLTRLSADTRTTAERLDTALTRLNRGEGTLGRFATDTTFYVETQSALRAIREFVDDLRKHPGKLNITFRVF